MMPRHLVPTPNERALAGSGLSRLARTPPGAVIPAGAALVLIALPVLVEAKIEPGRSELD